MVQLVRMTLIGGAIAVTVLLLLGAVGWMLWNSPTITSTTSDNVASSSGAPSGIAGPVGPPSKVAPASPAVDAGASKGKGAEPGKTGAPAGSIVPENRVGDWTDLVRAVDSATAMLDADRATSEQRFGIAAAEMSRRWPVASADQRLAAIDVLITFLYRNSNDDTSARRTIGVLSLGTDALVGVDSLSADQILPAAWSGGLLARLLRESNLSTDARVEIRRSYDRAFTNANAPATNSFDAGASATLNSLISGLLSRTAGTNEPQIARARWSSWIEAQRALQGPGTPETNRALLLALESLLTQSSSVSLRKDAFESCDVLVRAIQWRPGDESRDWVLRWFDSETIATGNLFAVTSSLANGANAPGVDPSMVLPATADASLRAELRTRYASAWGLAGGTSRDSMIAEWLKAATAQLDATTSGDAGDPLQRLRHAVVLARLNTIAERLHRGDVEGVGANLASLTENLDLLDRKPGVASLLDVSSLGNDAWLIRYRNAGASTPLRKELLNSYTNKPTIIDAAVIMEEAVRGSPSQVRQAARSLVLRYPTSHELTWALLNLAPTMPLTSDSAELISVFTGAALPSLRNPGFRVAARRALVNHMLDHMAGTGELQNVESLSRALALTYSDRLQPRIAPRSGSPASPTPAGKPEDADATKDPADIDTTRQAAPTLPRTDILTSARNWRARLLREAEGTVPSGKELAALPGIVRRHTARESLALGKVQDFAAQQIGACEILAYIVSSQKPDVAPVVASIMSTLESDRAKAPHVFTQIEAVERDTLRLWILRAGNRSPNDTTPSAPSVPAAPGAANGQIGAAMLAIGPIAFAPPASSDAPTSAVQRFAPRLSALNPTRPEQYLELGEEVADDARDAADRRLAIELFVLAFELDRGISKKAAKASTAASACIALAELIPAARDRAWLEAISLTLDPTSVRPKWLTRRSLNSADSTNFQVATVLGLVRAGEGRKAQLLLERREVSRALDASDRLMRQLGIDGGADSIRLLADRWPCPDCSNAGAIRRNRPPSPNSPPVDYHSCPTCRGYSAPRLSDAQILAQLRFEAILLSGTQDSWTSQIAVDMGSPLQDPDPDGLARFFAVNPALTIWRDGRWSSNPTTP
jgi:hypothetical protein